MFRACLTPLFLFVFTFGSAQDYAAVDSKVRAYGNFSDPDKLAAQIDRDFTSEDHKARAIFTWIATNIKYDVQQYLSNPNVREVAYSYRTPQEKAQKEQQFKDQIVMKTWRSKKGLCHGYSELYNYLAKRVGLESILIPGTSKSHPTHIGKLPVAADHAWNAVKTDGKWHLLDVTWAAGGIDGATRKFKPRFNDSYFFTDPEVFFLNHFPDDKRLLMTNHTPQEFADLPLFYGEYLASDYTILTPNNGTINAVAGTISFKINNFKGSRISYVFSNDNTFKNVTPTQVGNDAIFEIPVNPRASGYLTLFVNSSSIVTYKIQRG